MARTILQIKKMKNSTLVCIENAGHEVNKDNPEKLAETIAAFDSFVIF